LCKVVVYLLLQFGKKYNLSDRYCKSHFLSVEVMSIHRHYIIILSLLIITPIPRAGAHGFIDQQIASLSEQIEDAPRSLSLRLKRANHYRENGNMDSARSDIRFVLTLEPGQAEALMVLARLERESKNFEVAQVAIEEFITKNPGQSIALKERALIFSEANQWAQAAVAWQTYLESATNPDPESFLACSEAIQKHNQKSTAPHRALEVIDAGLKLHPDVVSLNHRMASLLIQNGDSERAQTYFIASRKRYPTLKPIRERGQTLNLNITILSS
jgi:tetratricopeptide (TPR) repeat protein